MQTNETIQNAPSASQKRGRGRPRKYAVAPKYYPHVTPRDQVMMRPAVAQKFAYFEAILRASGEKYDYLEKQTVLDAALNLAIHNIHEQMRTRGVTMRQLFKKFAQHNEKLAKEMEHTVVSYAQENVPRQI